MAPVLENTYCGLLSSEENLQIVKLLGNRCQSLCTTVVQLYLTKPPDHSQWFKKNSGKSINYPNFLNIVTIRYIYNM